MNLNNWPDDGFRDWIGRTHAASDLITDGLAERFRATVPLEKLPGNVPQMQLCIQWCLAPIAEPAEKLGQDGHPALGLHLPPIPLPRRMWAGGELSFHGSLAAGDLVKRVSTIRSIEPKQGRTGALVFVEVEHEYSTARGLAVNEIQSLVYRDPAGDTAKRAVSAERPSTKPLARIDTDPVLLFRYSALTFNGHRIHYDHPYATGVEGYAGLVVHGPLMATMLANLANAQLGGINKFRFRGQSPLICGETLELFANASADGGLELEARAGDGRLVMSAQAE